ncbi:MAG: hypothetical protein IKU25_07245 [Clostridia bacterium]|nr:hypothetical protein [Clostridia bacterium]
MLDIKVICRIIAHKNKNFNMLDVYNVGVIKWVISINDILHQKMYYDGGCILK